jgi:hypothetical protein
MFRHVILFVVALAIALSTYACLDVFVGIPCDRGTYEAQIFAGEDSDFCYYQRPTNAGGWKIEAVRK